MHTLFTFIGTALFVVPQPVYAEKPVIALEAGIVPTVESTLHLEAIKPITIEEKIVAKAKEYGVDPKLALAIVKCESNFQRYAKNPGSSAESYWQFLDSTWKYTMGMMGKPLDTSKFDEELSIEAGIFLLKKEGSRHWLESKPCWSKII